MTWRSLNISTSISSFLPHLIKNPLPLRVGRLVFGVFGHRKTVSPHFVDVGMGGQTNGIFSFVSSFVYIGGFLSSPSYNIFVNKPYIVNKTIHSIRGF